MRLEEVFLVHFTLLTYNIDYDSCNNPKFEMLKALKGKRLVSTAELVLNKIRSIPSDETKKQIADFLLQHFLINSSNRSMLTAFKGDLSDSYKMFQVDQIALALINSYYDNELALNKNIDIESENSDKFEIVNINVRLQSVFVDAIEKFLIMDYSWQKISSILTEVILERKNVPSDFSSELKSDLEFLLYYSRYFFHLIITQVYEDVCFYSANNNEIQYDDYILASNDYDALEIIGIETSFESTIVDLAERRTPITATPASFVEDLFRVYFEILDDTNRRYNNRLYMKKNHARQLIKMNPLSVFDEM